MRTRRHHYASPESPSRSADPSTDAYHSTDNHAYDRPIFSGRKRASAFQNHHAEIEASASSVQDGHHPTKKPRLDHYLSVPSATFMLRASRARTAARSRPSDDPSLQLMGIPPEIRDDIYRLLLVSHSRIIVSFVVKPYPHLSLKRNRHIRIGGKNAVSVLRVCKLAYLEATKVLYSRNTFYSFDVRDFRSCFIQHVHTGIGLVNAALIRKADFAIPVRVKHFPDVHLKAFASDFCKNLKGLRQLTLSAGEEIHWFTDERRPPASSQQLISQRCGQERRILLLAVAWITKRHPVLKKAIWKADNGGSISLLLGRCRCYAIRYSVTIVAERRHGSLGTTVKTLDEYGRNRKTKVCLVTLAGVKLTYLRISYWIARNSGTPTGRT